MTTFHEKYPPLKNCKYRVHLKGGRVVGPFESGDWEIVDVPDDSAGGATIPTLMLRFKAIPAKGSMAFTPEMIDRIEVVCPTRPAVEVEFLPIPDIELPPVPAPGGDPAPAPSPDPSPEPAACEEGAIQETYMGTEETDYVRDHFDDATQNVRDSLSAAVLDKLADYVPSLSHVTCWMYVFYVKTTREKYRRERCDNGRWVELPNPRIVTTKETVKLRMAIGGNPCLPWQQKERLAPEHYPDFGVDPDFGWIEDVSETTE